MHPMMERIEARGKMIIELIMCHGSLCCVVLHRAALESVYIRPFCVSLICKFATRSLCSSRDGRMISCQSNWLQPIRHAGKRSCYQELYANPFAGKRCCLAGTQDLLPRKSHSRHCKTLSALCSEVAQELRHQCTDTTVNQTSLISMLTKTMMKWSQACHAVKSRFSWAIVHGWVRLAWQLCTQSVSFFMDG